MIQHARRHNPELVLDVATGTAGVAMAMATQGSNVVGLDLTHRMIARGKQLVKESGLERKVWLTVGTADLLPFNERTFDALTFTYLLRYVDDPAETLMELGRVVKPGGLMASLEFGVPPNAFWHACWWAFTRWVLPAAGAFFGRGWFRVGRFLGPNITRHYERYPIDWHIDAWKKAGFIDVGFSRMSFGGGLVMWGTKADA